MYLKVTFFKTYRCIVKRHESMYIASVRIDRYSKFGEFIRSEEYPVFSADTWQECSDFCIEFEHTLQEGDVLKIGEHEFTIVSINDMDELGRFRINDQDYLDFSVTELNVLKLERIVEK